MTGVSHLKKAEQWLKTCEDYTPSAGEVMISTFVCVCVCVCVE